ncbi:MAG: ribosomal RNA small subunit methyltransferase A [Elusimicrobia bacterium GWA2_69_24]|nr:MAG: ribosomal RNA small subunit methyltransferase A [Elusimicrobia bacterium GWA2_69_24]HBL15510.1 ribosomal RNA small subunit methyltransferase A [Elusimicrobiota bacterium]
MGAKYDQHFLNDESVADRIVAAAGIRPGDAVVEIGPGRGILTGRLLQAGAELTAVEVDGRLVERLRERFAGEGRLKLVHSDWLKLDLGGLPAPKAIVSNLPYSMGNPILQSLLAWPGWSSAVLMFQKEVAERILSGPGSRGYGLLGLSVHIHASAELLCVVGRDSFDPPPRVDSAVLVLRRLSASRLPGDLPEGDFFRVVKAAFSQRRKVAPKALAAGLGIPKSRAEEALRGEGIAPTARAEDIGFEAFVGIARRLR